MDRWGSSIRLVAVGSIMRLVPFLTGEAVEEGCRVAGLLGAEL
jgi:hypothetical protein